LEEYRASAKVWGLDRVVIVQASAYGTDNSYMIDSLRRHPVVARGVAVIDDSVSDATLTEMRQAGVVGVRVGLLNVNITARAASQRLRVTSERVAQYGWHVQLLASPPLLAMLTDTLADLPTPIVVDHMGMSDASLGVDQPGLKELRDLLAVGRCWVKLSGTTHVSRQREGFRDAIPIMRSLIAANPERLIWGTDWPHINQQRINPNNPPRDVDFVPFDNLQLLRLLAEAARDEAVLNRVLVENPAKLYAFARPAM